MGGRGAVVGCALMVGGAKRKTGGGGENPPKNQNCDVFFLRLAHANNYLSFCSIDDNITAHSSRTKYIIINIISKTK